MRGLSSRVPGGEIDTVQGTITSPGGSVEAPGGLITMIPVWNAIAIEKKAISPAENTQMIIIGGTQKQKKAIKKLYPQAETLEIKPNANVDAISKQFYCLVAVVEGLLW